MNGGMVRRMCGEREINAGDVINESLASQRNYLNMLHPRNKMSLSAKLHVIAEPFSKGETSAGKFADLLMSPPREIVLATLKDRDVRFGHSNELADFPAIVFRNEKEILFMVFGTEGHISTNYFLQASLKKDSGATYTLVLPESIVLRDVRIREMVKWDGWNDRLELNQTKESPEGQMFFSRVGEDSLSANPSSYFGNKNLPDKSILLVEAVLEKAFAPLQQWFAERKLPAPWSVL